MPWIRWRTESSTGRRIAHLQWREGGRVRSRSLATTDPDLAALALAKAKTGDDSPAPDAGSIAARFWRHLELDRRPATISWYRRILGPLLEEWDGIPVRRWTRARLEEYLRPRLKTWSPRTAGMLLQCARVFVRWAREVEGASVPEFTKGVRLPKSQAREPDHISREELATLLQAARDRRLETAVGLCGLAGLRPSEMIHARTEDVRWLAPASIQVRGTKTYQDRTLPIGPKLLEILERHRGLGPLVRAPDHRDNLRRELRSICTRAGIRAINWYTLRHTFATHRVAEGVDLPTLQRLLGHRPGSTVTLRYLHTDVGRLAKAMENA